MTGKNGPLTGITVLDLTRMLPGPIATQILADLGAEVIRIESPQGDITRFTPPHISGQDRSEWSSLFLSVNRSKKGVLLNLQKEGHRQILVDLVKRADVFVEGFRPGVLAKFGFDYQSTSTMNQKIIYCSISGFGQTGPNKSKPAHDINYFGLAGWLSETDLVKDVNFPPVRLPLTPVADLTAGLFAVIGILAALYAQKATGKGTYVDTSIFESALFCISGFSSLLPLLNGLSPHAAEAFAGNPLSGNFPFFTLYLTKDRKWLSVGALEPVFWETLCKILNLSDLALRQYPESLEEAKAVYYRLQEVFLSKDRAEWLERFEGENTCVFPVHSLLDLRTDPQIIHRKMLYSVPHPGGGTFLAPRTPLLFSEWDQATPSPPPDTTTDAQAILQGLGYSDDMIKTYFDSL